MNRTTKIILIIVASLIVLGVIAVGSVALIAGRFVAKSVASSPAAVQEAAAKIADFDLPEGYETDYAIQMVGFTMAAYDPGDGHSHLMLIQFPSGVQVNESEMRRQLEKVARDPNRDQNRVRIVAQTPVTIRGQQATATYSEGTNSAGQPYRSVMAAFVGKGCGPAMIVFEEPVSRWDQARVDALIASIR